jgi:RNA polymerase sigma-70 factor (ECF subfamily)
MRATTAVLAESPVVRPPAGSNHGTKARPQADTSHGTLERRARSDSRDARLHALVSDHFDFIWRLLRRFGLAPADADDAAQHVFIIVAGKLDQVDAGSERTYLYGIALRVAANARRKNSRRRARDELHSSLDSPTDDFAGRLESQDLMQHLLERLEGDLRRVLVLAAIEGLELSEIAALESIPVGTAASRLRRAREQFRQHLARHEGANPFRKEEP